jgi:Raf kinase inhibitor-like YbhB/YbcL family protein
MWMRDGLIRQLSESIALGGKMNTFELKSFAFEAGGDIPKKFTCDGSDLSPALNWNEPPAGTQSFSLIMDDPDAPVGTWVHWVLYNLPASARQLPEGVPNDRELANSARQGSNSWNRIGYGGPCPPPGPAHRYFFKLYALDTKTNLRPGATKQELERALQGHILAQAELMGRFRR